MSIQAIFLMTEATSIALIVGGFGFAGVIVTSIVQIILAGRRTDRVVAQVGELKSEIDGKMTELKDNIAAKNLAEGQLKGIAGEQERVAELIVEPAKVTEAMNGKDVREQIDKIEIAVMKTEEVLAEEPVVRPAVRKQLDAIEKAVHDDK